VRVNDEKKGVRQLIARVTDDVNQESYANCVSEDASQDTLEDVVAACRQRASVETQ
jgi:hypothetical protein